MRVHERTHKDKDATLCVIVFGLFPGLFRRGGSTGQDLAIDQRGTAWNKPIREKPGRP
jgi:hypothetical protein